jgi:hypothetical protein
VFRAEYLAEFIDVGDTGSRKCTQPTQRWGRSTAARTFSPQKECDD